MARIKIWAQSDYQFTNYSYLSEAIVANFQNNGKIWISCVDKAFFSDGENSIQAKQWLDKCYSDSTPSKRWLRGGMLTLNAVVRTKMMLNAQVSQIRQLSWKTPKKKVFCSSLPWERKSHQYRILYSISDPFQGRNRPHQKKKKKKKNSQKWRRKNVLFH